MLKKKHSCNERKRKHSRVDEQRDAYRRRNTEFSTEDCKDDLTDQELDRIGSDIEDGGLDLSLPFQPIMAYVCDKQEMLQQCFRVLGEKKLRKMLPDELQGCSLEEIRILCLEQLGAISEKSLTQILAGEEVTSESVNGNKVPAPDSQQDNIVDSTSCLKENVKVEDSKQEGGGSSEESDVLSINADADDSDIEGPKEETVVKASDGAVVKAANNSNRATGKVVEAKKDVQSDIDKSVSEILAFSSGIKSVEETHARDTAATAPVTTAESGPSLSATCQPSVRQLELLELEMRARAIKALMNASNAKNPDLSKSVKTS